MIIRFGYVAMSMILEDASPSKTVTYANYKKLAQKDPEVALSKVRRVARENLNNCLRLLRHNKAYKIEVYRLSSRIIPLGTHPELAQWDYIKDLEQQFFELGEFIKENKMRISFHPDHYTVINTPNKEIFNKSLYYLEHHLKLFNAMGLDCNSKLVIHGGGGYKDKKASLERFVQNWDSLPEKLRCAIILENDDKIFTASEILHLCKKLSLPMVLDIHHFRCNSNEEESLAELAPEFVNTWNGSGLNPKIHVSSPRSEKDFLNHHDYVNTEDVYPFLKIMREYNINFDVMVEAKQKDLAMFKLVKELAQYPGLKAHGNAVLEFV